VVDNARKRAFCERFGYPLQQGQDTGGSTSGLKSTGKGPKTAREMVRKGMYLHWKTQLYHQKYVKLKREKEERDIEMMIQENLRKAHAAEAAEWAYFNNPLAFLTLAEKVGSTNHCLATFISSAWQY
jgi:hypothetical protein